MEKVLFWYGNIVKELDKEELFTFISKKLLTNKNRRHYDYHMAELMIFENMYEFLLKNLKEITCIQIYQDGVIRLRLKNAHYEQPKSIFLEDDDVCLDHMTFKMIEDLITFSRDSK